jgi:uncharacterized protein (TIGR02145 family)
MRPSRLLFILVACLPSLAFAQSSAPCAWNPDFDGDNAIGVNDLLALLGVFEEVDSDGDGIFDSQDDCVGVYDACGVCNGTGVDFDADGICDDVDPCLGALDECGVCNGPGPNFPVIDEIIYATDSVFLPPVGTWYVFSYAVDTLYTYVCPVQGCTDTQAENFNPLAVIEDGSCSYGPAQCGGQSTVTFDGYTYNLVGIGTQCWFKENLRSDNYRIGDAIPGNLSDAAWTSTTSGAQTVFGEGSSTVDGGSGDEVANLATYGRLYNWYAVNDARGLCPGGWHVPTDAEWTTLTDFLGGVFVAGHAMKSSPSDAPGWDGSNASGFSALPGGIRDGSGGSFFDEGYHGNWWSSSPNFSYFAWGRFLSSDDGYVDRPNGYGLNEGLSVRCVRD